MPEFKFTCPGCGQHIVCDDGYAGMCIQCPACQSGFVVPEARLPALPVPCNVSTDSRQVRRTGALRVPTNERVRTPNRETWINLGVGFGIAVVTAVVPMLNFIFAFLWILVHEMGHWLMSLFFAYSAIPAFDFISGGGVTMRSERWPFMFFYIYAVWAFLLWRVRRNRLSLAVLIAAVLLFAVAAHTWVHQALVLASGHGCQLLIAGTFLYRAWANVAIITRLERPFYAALGFNAIWDQLVFASGLMSDSDTRELYLEGKGYVDSDFVSLSSLLDMPMNLLLAALMVSAVLVLGVSFLAFRYQPYWHALLARLLNPKGALRLRN